MYASLAAFFSSLREARGVSRSLLRCFRYRVKRLLSAVSVEMAEEEQKARVTELLVRMDCNGCVQRIKRALHNIQGVHEVYTDIAQQKLTVVGSADPERIVKAIKRTKKIATICSHIDPTEPAFPANDQEPPSEEAPAAEQPAPAAEVPPATEPPMEHAKKLEMNIMQPEVHMVHEYPYHFFSRRDYPGVDPYYYSVNGARQYENNYSYSTHSYNSYRPSTHVSEYYHGHMRSPLQEGPYVVPAHGNNDYYPVRERTSDGQITSAFSDENPNACSIV